MNSRDRVLTAVLVLFVLSPAFAQVTYKRLLNSAKEPQNWMMYSGDYSGKRFSGLDQINKSKSMESSTRRRRTTAPSRSMRAPGGRSGCISGKCRRTFVPAAGA
jgi:hypothetical protein